MTHNANQLETCAVHVRSADELGHVAIATTSGWIENLLGLEMTDEGYDAWLAMAGRRFPSQIDAATQLWAEAQADPIETRRAWLEAGWAAAPTIN